MSRRRAPRGWPAVIVASLAIASAWAASIALYLHHGRALAREAEARRHLEEAGPRVQVVQVRRGALAHEVELPGDARAFAQATLYAKVSGYLREISVDKGDRVRAGQLLGRIESPETDEQVRGARALWRSDHLVARRARALLRRRLVAPQDVDVAGAAERSARATLAQEVALQGYERIRAPFDGRVTQRYVDPGALLQAATGSAAGAQPLVDVQRDDVLRVTVYLGQEAAPHVRVGDPAELWSDAAPDRILRARVSRFAGALDPRTRTMLCEIDLDNRAGAVVPGTYLHVRLHFSAVPLPIVPDEAVLERGGQIDVAVVENDHLHLTPIRPGRDDGRETQIERGVDPGQWVALNVSASVRDGQRVQPLFSPPASAGRRAVRRPGGGPPGAQPKRLPDQTPPP